MIRPEIDLSGGVDDGVRGWHRCGVVELVVDSDVDDT